MIGESIRNFELISGILINETHQNSRSYMLFISHFRLINLDHNNRIRKAITPLCEPLELVKPHSNALRIGGLYVDQLPLRPHR